jgi:two-component system OmpR family sensor kinase
LTRRSLRARLIVGVLVLVAVAIGAVSTITYAELRSFLIDRTDRQLRMTPPGLASSCERPDRGVPRPLVPALTTRLGPDGHVGTPCPDNGFQRPLELTDADAARLIARPGTPVELVTAEGTVRAIAWPARYGGGWEVVGQSLADVQGTLDRLLLLELLVGALALVGVGALGAVGVARGLRPLTRVTDTAQTVAGEVSSGSGGLQRRVPDGDPGTEVGKLGEAFNTMLDAVQTEVAGRQASEQRMRQFLADASHELRTPLTSLRGYAELITMREARDGVQRDPESADALRRITEEGARMARLVEDLLVLARSDAASGSARWDDPVALDELAADAVTDLRASFAGRSLTLDAEPGCVVSGDRDQLRQVLNNLIGNAAVHTDGAVRVGVDRVGGEVRLTVADDGPGLAPPQAAHVFDRFWRADSARTRARGGSGLGLAIVDALVGGHGGTIDFDTAPATGTTVTVRFPSAP